jgi:hypothetical protein
MFSALRVAFGPATLFLAAGLALGTPLSPSNADAAGDAAPPVLLAQAAPDPAIAEKEAFEAAKELGTVDAWNAFLKTYATGFRADLARAYIAKLGQDAAPATAIAPPPSQVVAPPVQATTPPPVEPRLGLIDLGPGVAPWQNGMLDLDDGNRPAYVAQVAGNGMELIAYCRPPETKKGAYSLALRLHENPRGVYPEFDMRLQQGIDGSPAAGPDFRQIALRFDDGSVFGVTGRVFGMTGELEITENGKPLAPTGKIIESIMGGRTMTVLADPFSGTFQLSNSRPAICSVLAACGVRISACKGIAAPKISSKQITPLKQTKTFVPAQQGGGAALVIQQTATGPCPDPKAQVRNSAGQCVCSALYTSVGGQCVKACVGATRDQNGNCQCPVGQPNPYGYCIDGTDQASIQKTVKAGEATTCPDGRLRDVSGNCLGWCSGERIWNGQKCISAKEAKNYYCRDLGIPEAGAQNGACKAAPGSVAAKFIPGQGTGQPQGGASPIFQLFQGPQGGQGAGTGATLTI